VPIHQLSGWCGESFRCICCSSATCRHSLLPVRLKRPVPPVQTELWKQCDWHNTCLSALRRRFQNYIYLAAMKKGICFQNLSTLATMSTMASCGNYMTLLHHITSIYLDLLLVNVWTPATQHFCHQYRDKFRQAVGPCRAFNSASLPGGFKAVARSSRTKGGATCHCQPRSLEIFEIFTPQVVMRKNRQGF
jgi:hypothetical protein